MSIDQRFALPSEFAKNGGKCPGYLLPLSRWTFGGEFEAILPLDSSDPDVASTRVGSYHGSPCFTTWIPRYIPHFGAVVSEGLTKCEHDGSVHASNGSGRGVEFVTPTVQGASGIKYICDVADKLKAVGCRVNHTCGFHIHVGLKGIVGNAKVDCVVAFLAQLNKLVLNFQDGLYAQTGTRRDRNNYCRRHVGNESLMDAAKIIGDKPKGSKTVSDFNRIADFAERYRCVNLRRLQHGMSDAAATLEFRFPAGTLNKDKILMHLASIIFLCRLAWKTRHTKADSVTWNLNKGYHRVAGKAGVRTLEVLLRKLNDSKQGRYLIHESSTFALHWDSMQEVAMRMARKYDNRQ